MSSKEEEKDVNDRREFFKGAISGAAGAAALAAAMSQLGVPVLNAAQDIQIKPNIPDVEPNSKQFVSPVFRNSPPWPKGTEGNRYDHLFGYNLREPSSIPGVVAGPQTYFRGLSDLPGGEGFHGAKVNLGWQIFTRPHRLELESHHHGHDEYIFFLGATLPDLVGSFDAEIEFFLGPEYERYVVTRASALYIPGGLEHNPCEIRKVGKPLLISAVAMAPFYNAIYQTRGYQVKTATKMD